MSAAEAVTPASTQEPDPKKALMEAVKDGRIFELFAADSREAVADALTGEDDDLGDYVSLTPTPTAPVRLSGTDLENMLNERRPKGSELAEEAHR